jgi:hypothetical protein
MTFVPCPPPILPASIRGAFKAENQESPVLRIRAFRFVRRVYPARAGMEICSLKTCRGTTGFSLTGSWL